MTSELRLHKFHTNDIHCYPDLGSASDWLCRERNLLQPIKSATHIWVVNVITEWNLWSRCSDVTSREPVVASWNIGCFLRLLYKVTTALTSISKLTRNTCIARIVSCRKPISAFIWYCVATGISDRTPDQLVLSHELDENFMRKQGIKAELVWLAI